MIYQTQIHEIPTMYDVAVVGGGPAGYCAAIAAARHGARTVILESMGSLGGMATQGLVCRLDTTNDGVRPVVGGIFREVFEEVIRRGGISSYYNLERLTRRRGMWTPFDPEVLKLVLDDMVTSSGAEIRFFTRAVDLSMDGRSIRGLVIHDVEGLHFLRSKVFIDATGDGLIAFQSGIPCRIANTPETPGVMPPTLCSFFSHIPWDEIPMHDKSPKLHAEKLKIAMTDGFFSQKDYLVPGIARNCADTGGMNAGHEFGLDALNAKQLSEGMIHGRKLVQEYASYYRKYVPGFEQMQLVATASVMGVRESRRIIGKTVLSIDDYLARRKWQSQIGLYSKQLDMHPYDESDAEFQRFLREGSAQFQLQDGESYGLPYEMMVSDLVDNLIVAGRCASSDRMMNSAVRVQPAAGIMGHAAGVSAYLCAKSGCGVTCVNVPELQKELTSEGAVLV